MNYFGYHKNGTLPVKPGEYVIIPKGTPFQSTHPSRKSGMTKRAMKVRVNWVNCGADMDKGMFEYEVKRYGRNPEPIAIIQREMFGTIEDRYVTENPKIVYPGSGGYWVYVDINLVKLIESNSACEL